MFRFERFLGGRGKGERVYKKLNGESDTVNTKLSREHIQQDVGSGFIYLPRHTRKVEVSAWEFVLLACFYSDQSRAI